MIFYGRRRSDEIGKHARLKIACRKVCGFKSHLWHMQNKIKKGIYKHFKGKEYEVIDVGTHSETLEPHVVYQALYGEQKIWVRPLSIFLEEVDKPEINYKGQRFTYVREK